MRAIHGYVRFSRHCVTHVAKRTVASVCRMVYATRMLDVMTALRDRRLKAEAKVVRAAKALETAEKELGDVMAAERVMAELTGESVEQVADGAPVSDRDREIAKTLATNPHEASTPAELHGVYTKETGDSINLDAFRTALWRLQKKVVRGDEKSWTVKSQGGRYWREPAYETSVDVRELLGGAE